MDSETINFCKPEQVRAIHPRVKSNHGKRTFDYVGPRLWNSLPPDTRKAKNIEIYKKQLKTILFEGTDEIKKRAFMYN